MEAVRKTIGPWSKKDPRRPCANCGHPAVAHYDQLDLCRLCTCSHFIDSARKQ